MPVSPFKWNWYFWKSLLAKSPFAQTKDQRTRVPFRNILSNNCTSAFLFFKKNHKYLLSSSCLENPPLSLHLLRFYFHFLWEALWTFSSCASLCAEGLRSTVSTSPCVLWHTDCFSPMGFVSLIIVNSLRPVFGLTTVFLILHGTSLHVKSEVGDRLVFGSVSRVGTPPVCSHLTILLKMASVVSLLVLISPIWFLVHFKGKVNTCWLNEWFSPSLHHPHP